MVWAKYGAAVRRHGQTGTHTYDAWRALRRRCKRKQEPLDPRWDRFEVFRADMGRRPNTGRICRLDSTLPWGPGNAIWQVED